MKKTTYCIIALLIAIFVGLTTFVISEKDNNVTLTLGELYTNPIECSDPITEVDFSMGNDDTFLPLAFGGLDVELTDSVDGPVLYVDSIFSENITTQVTGNRLNISLRGYASIERSKVKEVYVKNPSSLRLIMPEWPVTHVTSTHGRLRIKNLTTDKLKIFNNGQLWLTDCRIDSASLTSAGYAKIWLKDTEINFMSLDMQDNYIKIDCCDSTGVIHKLDFKPVKDVKTDMFLNPANIDTLLWNRNDSAQLTIRTKHPINIVK